MTATNHALKSLPSSSSQEQPLPPPPSPPSAATPGFGAASFRRKALLPHNSKPYYRLSDSLSTFLLSIRANLQQRNQ
ncbi:hypothetical protein L2E82_08054 [Cichorium intybus]|uniref:Uncharacterized protein n=1 Tax=Cichorium intybus TaxID=13427 RepID=A0ACB9G633_CICIN|nr:hypothetical protein L2E82_08054 [Cichorium intybus]